MKLWIARDKHIPDGTFPYPKDFNGNLFLYGSEPYIEKYTSREGVWTCKREEFIELDYKLFPEITFENSPQEIELKLVSEIIGITESPSKTFPTEKLVDDSIEFGKNVMKKKISEYLLKYLPMTPDDKEVFVEEMLKKLKI